MRHEKVSRGRRRSGRLLPLVALVLFLGPASCSQQPDPPHPDGQDDAPAAVQDSEGCGLTSQELLTRVLGPQLDSSTGHALPAQPTAGTAADCTTALKADPATFVMIAVSVLPPEKVATDRETLQTAAKYCPDSRDLAISGATGYICVNGRANPRQTTLSAVWKTTQIGIIVARPKINSADVGHVVEIAEQLGQRMQLDKP